MDETAIILLQQQYYCTLWKYLFYAGKIGKRNFIFLRFGLPFTLVREQKWSFSKTLFKPEVSEESFAFRSRVHQKHFENGAFRT